MNISDILSNNPAQQAILWHASASHSSSFTYTELSEAAGRVATLIGQETPLVSTDDTVHFHGVMLAHGPPIVAVLMG